GLPLRRALAGAIRWHRPEVVVSVNFREEWPGGGFNMADHRVLGLAVADAVRDAANRWVFRDLDLEPWQGVRFALFSGSPRAAHYTDVTGHLQAGIDSLLAHRTYFATLGADFDAPRMLTEAAEESGRAAGVRHATTCEMIESWPRRRASPRCPAMVPPTISSTLATAAARTATAAATSDRTTSAHRPPTTIAAADACIPGRARRCTISQDSSSAMLRSVLIPANPLRASLPSAVRLPTKPMTTPATTSTTPATAKPPLLTLACGAMISALSNGGSVEPAACASAARV